MCVGYICICDGLMKFFEVKSKKKIVLKKKCKHYIYNSNKLVTKIQLNLQLSFNCVRNRQQFKIC